FFAELFQTDLVNRSDQLRVLIVGIMVSLGAFGPMLCIRLATKYGQLNFYSADEGIRLVRLAGAADRLFFVAFAMLVGGFVGALLWDVLFPNECDYHVLMPLPLRL